MIVDGTYCGTLLYVAVAIAIEGAAFSTRLTATRFFWPAFRNSAQPAWTAWWGLTWDEDVLEPDERCVDINRRRASEGSADHDGTPDEAAADRNCGD
jgi:hypothetical protein